MNTATDDLNEYKNISSHLSNSRTFLSQVRTSLSFVTFGITLNRFSIYLLEKETGAPSPGVFALHENRYVGVGMVLLGALMLLYSTYSYHRVSLAITSGIYLPPGKFFALVTATFILVAVGGAFWMIVG